ncbi:MAG: universal stress protein [Silicimonas sp.]|nr:universal stress protein [Silicimonas sp.]
MYSHIMVPVDLAEKDTLEKAITTAADLARHYGARMTLVSVSGGIQAKVSHSNAEYGRRLAQFADDISATHGITIGAKNYSVPDPSVEVDKKLVQAIEDLNADLAIIASHQPGWVEYIVNSHGGRLASHAPISVFVVREER